MYFILESLKTCLLLLCWVIYKQPLTFHYRCSYLMGSVESVSHWGRTTVVTYQRLWKRIVSQSQTHTHYGKQWGAASCVLLFATLSHPLSLVRGSMCTCLPQKAAHFIKKINPFPSFLSLFFPPSSFSPSHTLSLSIPPAYSDVLFCLSNHFYANVIAHSHRKLSISTT